jgi:prepilin-type N-terminal cleavage/methylation domain-containing protein
MKLSFKLTSPVRKRAVENRVADAFTLVELLVVVCVLGLLAATLAPTLAGSRVGSQTFRCLNNNRQLATAWRMYADDSSDRVVYASTGGATTNDVYAWTGGQVDDPLNSGDWDPNADIVKRSLSFGSLVRLRGRCSQTTSSHLLNEPFCRWNFARARHGSLGNGWRPGTHISHLFKND